MASSVIHMCVAKKINETLKIKDENMLLLGSIAPDISKHLGESKTRSHFFDDNENVDMNRFLEKYKNKLLEKIKKHLAIKVPSCYNNRRYFLLLVSQECTGTC